MTRTVWLTALTVALAAAPAFAAEPAEAPPPPAPNPWVAVGLSAAAPVVLGGTAVLVGANNPTSLPMLIGLMPAGLSAGYLYAGDPGRALGVTLGGYGMAGLGALAMTGLVLASPASGQGKGFAMGVAPVIGAGLASAVYSGWALFDVYQTAERQKARASAAE